MSDLYSLYLLEKENKETLEIPDVGFITYKVVGSVAHICVLYVKPLHRNATNARNLVKAMLAKLEKQNLKGITAACFTKQNDTTNTLKILLHYGFEVIGTQNDDILLYKDL